MKCSEIVSGPPIALENLFSPQFIPGSLARSDLGNGECVDGYAFDSSTLPRGFTQKVTGIQSNSVKDGCNKYQIEGREQGGNMP
jgi:hypothetical protein